MNQGEFDSEAENYAQIKAIVTDIEGTTTPIPFVKDVLFPYILKNLESFLEREWDNSDLKLLLKDLQLQSLEDLKNEVSGVVEIPDVEGEPEKVKSAIISSVKWQMSIDRKIAPLKNLQGYMWRLGYQTGELRSIVYPDVKAAFERWTNKDIPVYIYSSGSIPAQKLLFQYSDQGDLLQYLKGHFDTSTAGSKLESKSYTLISRAIECDPSTILFLSDQIKEIEAANQAGFQTILMIRPLNHHIDESELQTHKHLFSFDGII